MLRKLAAILFRHSHSTSDRHVRRTVRCSSPRLEAVEPRISLSGFSLGQGSLIGLSHQPTFPGQSAMIIAI